MIKLYLLESYNALDKLFNVFEPINLPRYYEFRTYTKSAYLVGEKENAKRGLIRLAKEFGLEWSHINYDEVLKKIVEEFMITHHVFKCTYCGCIKYSYAVY